MKSAFRSFQIVLLLCGVFGAKGDEVKSVMEGESVTLDANLTQIKTFNRLDWRFEDQVIAQINRNGISYPNHTEFRDRLQLYQTGSLTIKNMKVKHSGLYELEISHNKGTLREKFSVTVSESSASEAGKAEIKSLSLLERASVTLQTDVTKQHGDELIVWRFGDEGKLIAKADIEDKSPPLYYEERFRDRLKIENNTGSLIITNTRTTDSGLYTVKISSSTQTLYKTFTVTVREPGLSAGAKAGIVTVVLLLAAAAAAAVIYYRHKISELQKQTLTVLVLEEDDVLLKPNSKINKDDVIQWQFGDEQQQTGIAEIRGEPREPFTYDNVAGGRFKDVLYLDETTGSLTIKNSRPEHSGLYTLYIRSSSGKVSQERFVVTVKESLYEKSAENGSVTLGTVYRIQEGDQLLWMFGHQEDVIAQRKQGILEIYDSRFRDRLELDKETRKLTVTNIESEHTGLYKLLIISSSGKTIYNKFRVYKPCEHEVAAGESVHLKTDLKNIKTDDEIQWMFRDEDSLIAEIKGGIRKTYDGPGGIFRDRLELDKKTGSLTIKNSTSKHTGSYRLKSRRSRMKTNKIHIVTVRDSTGNQGNESATVEMQPLNR